MIDVGDKVRDIITGFVGVIVAKTEWLNGRVCCGIQSQSLDKDGKIIELEWIDIEQLEIVESESFTAPTAI